MVGLSIPINGRPELSRRRRFRAKPLGVRPYSAVIQIDITNEQSRLPVDEDRLRRAISSVFAAAECHSGAVSVAVVDDPKIHELNRRFLQHDYPTDVLSFVLEESPGAIEGEIIVSADTAATTAADYDWRAEDELLLYVVHGALHLVGYDDKSPDDAAEMRQLEAQHLTEFGLQPPHAINSAELSGRPTLLRKGCQT